MSRRLFWIGDESIYQGPDDDGCTLIDGDGDLAPIDLKAGVQAWYGIIGNLNGVYHPDDAEELRMMAAKAFFDAVVGEETP